MNRKRIIIITIVLILVVILGLWVSGIIPKQIARIFATNYLKTNFSKMQLEYVDIEWSSSFGGYSIRFKDENNEIYSFIMNNKYFPVTLGQGLFGFEEEYREKYEKLNTENINNGHKSEEKNNQAKKITWEEITENGVDEELLFQNTDTKCLEKIAILLQSLNAEIAQKEKEDIDFCLGSKWYEYTLDSSQFNEVIDMGNDAIKPLYIIIYKSPNQGSYEYICAMALAELTHFDNVTKSWSTSKEFLEKFNQEVISNRER